MSDYNDILDTEIDPGSPVTTSLFARLRDNPEAIAEGALNAPQINTAALAAEAVYRDNFKLPLNRQQLVGARAAFTVGATITIHRTHNIQAITETAQGTYFLYYANPLDRVSYPVVIHNENRNAIANLGFNISEQTNRTQALIQSIYRGGFTFAGRIEFTAFASW